MSAWTAGSIDIQLKIYLPPQQKTQGVSCSQLKRLARFRYKPLPLCVLPSRQPYESRYSVHMLSWILLGLRRTLNLSELSALLRNVIYSFPWQWRSTCIPPTPKQRGHDILICTNRNKRRPNTTRPQSMIFLEGTSGCTMRKKSGYLCWLVIALPRAAGVLKNKTIKQ